MEQPAAQNHPARPELSPMAILIGVIIGVLFGAANIYIGLKVGMTVSASIPAAVIAMAVISGILKKSSILESNMAQTIGSVGESLAAGMLFTIPALFIFAYKDKNPDLAPSFWEMTIWGTLGGLLGVLFMIPLRRMLIVREHGTLPYPEGTACAEVLRSGERGGAAASTVFQGVGLGGFYELLRQLGFWPETAKLAIPMLRTEATLAAEPSLLGVGYILGIRVAGFMLAGAVLGWFILIPTFSYFGATADVTISPSEAPLNQMSPGAMWDKYLRYVGAGAVVLGGILSLIRSLKTIGASVFHMFGGKRSADRTDRDIPLPILLLLLIGLGAALWLLPDAGLLHHVFKSIPLIACVIGFGFFFVTVSSRLVGVVGSSSNPASGMTIATILGTSLILVYAVNLNLPPDQMKFAIISVGALVCMAICLAGDCSQDLKTGFLVGATPWKQQVGEILGVVTAVAALAGVIALVNHNFGFVKDATHPAAFLAPQANLMQLLVKGVVETDLPWTLILIGVACALIVELLGIPSLPFSVGLYLPLSLSTPIMAGALIRWLVERARGPAPEGSDRGILGASGLVAGQGLMGVAVIAVAALIAWRWPTARFQPPERPQRTAAAAEEPSAATAALITPFGLTGGGVSVQSDPNDEPPTPPAGKPEPDPNANEPAPVAPAVTQPPTATSPQPAAEEPPTAELAKPLPEATEPEHGQSEPVLATESAPNPEATKPARIADEKGDLVMPHHLQPWMSKEFGFPVDYGLPQQRVGAWIIDWYMLLPLAPFGVLGIWLAIVAMKREPEAP
ncbi:MAG: oligopeptide transporter, OPT family [Phycisphaerales bacterium]|nr:oligopeptide transporter, OPT family [Phycisphaerales bacterium]